MMNREPLAEKIPSSLDHPEPASWDEAQHVLAEGQYYWLATASPDGKPHVRPILAVWLNDTLYFASTPTTHKAKILARNAHCTLTIGGEKSLLVVEGEAVKVSSESKLRHVAAVYASKYDWQVEVRDGAFYADGAPTAGKPPFEIYEVVISKVLGFGKEESFSPTRWRF
jgi:nitroimidazol reductase NimA-like FMN-containing flavoprotein (pyridoxamine 5'-phosphate oxidase superfamily)